MPPQHLPKLTHLIVISKFAIPLSKGILRLGQTLEVVHLVAAHWLDHNVGRLHVLVRPRNGILELDWLQWHLGKRLHTLAHGELEIGVVV